MFKEYLDKFKSPVNVDVKKYEGSKDPDSGVDWYVYVYIVRETRPISFALNISCPGAGVSSMYAKNGSTGQYGWVNVKDVSKIEEIIGSDPVRKNEPAIVKDGRVIWPLDLSGGAQGMWFYSRQPPTKRSYEIKRENGSVKSGLIDGPSC